MTFSVSSNHGLVLHYLKTSRVIIPDKCKKRLGELLIGSSTVIMTKVCLIKFRALPENEVIMTLFCLRTLRKINDCLKYFEDGDPLKRVKFFVQHTITESDEMLSTIFPKKIK